MACPVLQSTLVRVLRSSSQAALSQTHSKLGSLTPVASLGTKLDPFCKGSTSTETRRGYRTVAAYNGRSLVKRHGPKTHNYDDNIGKPWGHLGGGRLTPSCGVFVTHLATVQVAGLSSATGQQARVEVTQNGTQVMVEVGGHHSKFHNAWLRHNCHCESCRQAFSGQKTFSPHQILPSYTISDIQLQGDNVVIQFAEESGSHTTIVPLQFLQDNEYSMEALHKTTEERTPNIQKGRFPELLYAEVEESRQGLLRWLQYLNNDGVCILTGVPCEPGMVRVVAEKIWKIQQTIYGETFDVISTPQPINIAYSSAALGFHTDLMYYESAPGIQFLHCLEFDACVEGGESTFVDSWVVAEQLRAEDPVAFHTLTQVPATFQKIHFDRERPVYMKYQRPHIVVNRTGVIISVNWSPPFEGPLHVPEEEVEPYYRAYHKFANLLETSEYRLKRKMVPGDLIAFNNRRVLHGREAFSQTAGARHLEGCYLNIDEFKNQVEVLSRQVGDGSPAKRVGNHCLF